MPSLKSQWLSLCSRIEIEGDQQWNHLHEAYTTSGLAYHNLNHIEDCLQKFTARKDEATDPLAVELAIWFHDAIYDPRASDNEEQSADLAAKFLSGTKFHQSVPDLIIATKHTGEPATTDEKLLCDIDLSILASPPETYRQYSTAIRDEYSWVPGSDYRSGRTKILQHFLARPSIYFLESSRKAHESAARRNLQSEIEALRLQN